jgi:hypothetical protein
MKEIQETLNLEKEHPEGGSWRDMVKPPSYRWRCLIALVLGIYV